MPIIKSYSSIYDFVANIPLNDTKFGIETPIEYNSVLIIPPAVSIPLVPIQDRSKLFIISSDTMQ